MKYIIKNCPCLYILRDMDLICKDTPNEQKECHLIPDCLLKQIVELCKKAEYRVFNHKYEVIGIRPSPLAQKILNLLEIEEVNE